MSGARLLCWRIGAVGYCSTTAHKTRRQNALDAQVRRISWVSGARPAWGRYQPPHRRSQPATLCERRLRAPFCCPVSDIVPQVSNRSRSGGCTAERVSETGDPCWPSILSLRGQAFAPACVARNPVTRARADPSSPRPLRRALLGRPRPWRESLPLHRAWPRRGA